MGCIELQGPWLRKLLLLTLNCLPRLLCLKLFTACLYCSCMAMKWCSWIYHVTKSDPFLCRSGARTGPGLAAETDDASLVSTGKWCTSTGATVIADLHCCPRQYSQYACTDTFFITAVFLKPVFNFGKFYYFSELIQLLNFPGYNVLLRVWLSLSTCMLPWHFTGVKIKGLALLVMCMLMYPTCRSACLSDRLQTMHSCVVWYGWPLSSAIPQYGVYPSIKWASR